MSDLISRSALLARYDRIHVGAPGAARKLIEEAPAVDAVLVVHGWWIEEAAYGFIGRCSVCKKLFDAAMPFNYCPSCGAKMDGGTDETV